MSRWLTLLGIGWAACMALPTAHADATHPELKVETLEHGSYDLATRRGNWVLVNFWATWCAPCLKEMPELDAFDAEHANAEVIGLAWEEIEVADLRAFLKTRPVRYPIAQVDVYQPPADLPTPRGLPLSLLIDPEGRVHKQFLGPVTAAELAQAMEGPAGTP